MVQLSSILSKTKKMNGLLFSRPKDGQKFIKSFERVFTRTLIRQHDGLEVGLEFAKSSLDKSQHFFRRLDDKKKERMAKIFLNKLDEMFSQGAEFRQAMVVFSKVEVPTVFDHLKIFWKSYGDERDETISLLLEKLSPDINKRLSYELSGSTMPKLIFYPDRSPMYVEQMDKLFEQADYGAGYKPTTKNTFFGAPNNTEEGKMDTDEEKIPRFVQKVRIHSEQRKAERKKRAEITLDNEIN